MSDTQEVKKSAVNQMQERANNILYLPKEKFYLLMAKTALVIFSVLVIFTLLAENKEMSIEGAALVSFYTFAAMVAVRWSTWALGYWPKEE